MKKKVILIAGLSGSGKTTLANQLSSSIPGSLHVTFTQRAATNSAGRGSVIHGIKKAIQLGPSLVSKTAVESIIADFEQKGAHVLIVDGILHTREIEQFRNHFGYHQVKVVMIETPVAARIARIKLRRRGKGGGSIVSATLWLGIMDFLQKPFLGLSNLAKVRKESSVILTNANGRKEFGRLVKSALLRK